MAEYNWAILGCGVIAHQLADAMKAKGRTLYSVANRTYDKAISFAEEYGIKMSILFIFPLLTTRILNI